MQTIGTEGDLKCVGESIEAARYTRTKNSKTYGKHEYQKHSQLGRDALQRSCLDGVRAYTSSEPNPKVEGFHCTDLYSLEAGMRAFTGAKKRLRSD